MARRGRPAPAGERRNETIEFRLTLAEKDAVRAAAEHEGIDVAELVREATLERARAILGR